MTAKIPVLREGQYSNEGSSFDDFGNVSRFFMPRKLRESRTSPPVAADVPELTLVYDKTANRLYTKVNGALKYVAFS